MHVISLAGDYDRKTGWPSYRRRNAFRQSPLKGWRILSEAIKCAQAIAEDKAKGEELTCK
jgi:hypothetical protein